MKRKTKQPLSPAAAREPDKMSLRFVLPLVLFFLVCGVLLIWLDALVLSIASYILAALLAGGGIWKLVCYFRSDVPRRIAGMDLALGLICLLVGVLIAFNPHELDSIFPSIWGLSLIFGGFLKVQYAFDEKSIRVSRWWIMLIFAAFSLLIGILAFLRPAFFGENKNLIIGIMMLVEAVLDVATFLLIRSGLKKLTDAQAPVPPPDLEPAPAPVPVPDPLPPEAPATPADHPAPAQEVSE